MEATVIVTLLLVEAMGEPLSVAANVTANVIPCWFWLGVKEKVPEAGFPVTVGKLMPETRPVALRVTTLAGRSLSVALTEKVVVEFTVAVAVDGLEMVGATLTSETVMLTLAELSAPRLSVAVNVTE